MIAETLRRMILEGEARIAARRPPSAAAPLAGEPADLLALYAVSDGIDLADDTRILARGEIAAATAWLVSEKSLGWGADLWVIGERDDLVIVRDLDVAGARAGGGVLEAPTDGLTALRRVAIDVVGYLEDRLGHPRHDGAGARARGARGRDEGRQGGAGEGDRAGLLSRGRARFAHAALSLGVLRAGAGDAAGAMAAFEEAVAARVRAAPRGAEASETRAGWRTCAVAAEKAGAGEVAQRCRGWAWATLPRQRELMTAEAKRFWTELVGSKEAGAVAWHLGSTARRLGSTARHRGAGCGPPASAAPGCSFRASPTRPRAAAGRAAAPAPARGAARCAARSRPARRRCP